MERGSAGSTGRRFPRSLVVLVALLALGAALAGPAALQNCSGTPARLAAAPTPVATTVPTTAVEKTPTPVLAGAAFTRPTTAVTTAPTSIGLRRAPGDRNLLLLGTDLFAGMRPPWRTDSIMLVAIRPQAGFVALFSIPRDLWVNIPGHGDGRINVADYEGEVAYGPGGGPRLLAEILQTNLGIGPVNGYVRIHPAGLVHVIDALGGITVDVDQALPEDGIPAGVQRMDGKRAVEYGRERHSTGDLDRTRRWQKVALAICAEALRPDNLLRLPALASALSDAVDTDLSLGDLPGFVDLACRLGPGDYRTRVFDNTMVREWVTPGGAMVLLPRREAIERAWAELTSTAR